jgi:homoserine kinase type II
MMNNLICQECPNGCNLSLEWKDQTHALIVGNKCARGVGYAGRILRQDQKVYVASKEKTPAVSETTIKDIVRSWGIALSKLRYDIPVQGSPERSVFRVVFEDDAKNLFVLEQLFLKTLAAKRNIAKTLELLAQRKLEFIRPYKNSLQGEAIVKYKSGFWQIADFVPGVELNRTTYMFEKWRGVLLAKFLIDLREKSKDLPFFHTKKTFSLKDYVYRLAGHVKMYKPSLQEEIVPVMDFLEKELMPSYDKFPISFCHGDYHPMNIIWSKNDINCVIDWEFLGYKSEIYDMANLIGCIGIENPLALQGELVQNFIAEIKKAQIISGTGWRYLLEFIIALRFAWLSEWLRRHDEEMITLEMDYMRLLMENKKILYKAWGL